MKVKNKLIQGVRSTALTALCMLMFVVSFTSCGKEKKNYEPNDEVARIGDETVTYALYKAAFDSYASYFKQMGYDPLANDSEVSSFQDLVINALVSDTVVLYHAKQDDFTLDEAAEEEVRAQAAKELEEIRSDYMTLAEQACSNDSTLTVQQHFDRLIAELSLYYTGTSMTFDEYSEEYTRELINSKLIEEYQAHICGNFTVTEAQIADWYSKQYEADERNYTDNPEQYKEVAEHFERFGASQDAYPPTYIPEGYSRIMDIVVRPSGTIGEEYTSKTQQLASIGEECSALLFNDALAGNNSNEARIRELLEQYRALQTETDAMYEEFTREAREKIDRAYAELEEGRPFSEVMLEYTENTAVTGDEDTPACEAFVTKGQLISLTYTSANDWSGTVKEIYGMIEEGAYSAVFADDDGSFHIIYRGEAEPAGKVELEKLNSAIEAIVRAEHSDSDWDELLDAWLDDPDLTINMEMVRSLGKDDVSEPPAALTNE